MARYPIMLGSGLFLCLVATALQHRGLRGGDLVGPAVFAWLGIALGAWGVIGIVFWVASWLLRIHGGRWGEED